MNAKANRGHRVRYRPASRASRSRLGSGGAWHPRTAMPEGPATTPCTSPGRTKITSPAWIGVIRSPSFSQPEPVNTKSTSSDSSWTCWGNSSPGSYRVWLTVTCRAPISRDTMMFVIVSPIARGFPSRFTLRIVAMELPPLLVYRVRRSLRWREEDDQPQVLRDGMKPMRQSGRREYDAARLHRTVLVVNPNHGSAADDVVDLLLLVRLLRIDATSREDVQAEAERWHAEEFEIELAGFHALPVEVGEFEGVHRVATLANRASWSQGSPLFSWTSRSTSPRSSGMRENSISAGGVTNEFQAGHVDEVIATGLMGPSGLARRSEDRRPD